MLPSRILPLLFAHRTRAVRSSSRQGGFRALCFERLDARCLLAHDTLAGFGAAGDSISDEYRGEAYDYAMNWVELLAEHQQTNFGSVADWGEPRRDGYEYNWARSGATSASLLADGQHTGLAGQIAAGQVSHAVLAIGQNDFFPADAVYLGIYFGTWSQQQIDDHVDSVVSNIQAALDTLIASDVHLVVSNIIDYGVAGATRQILTRAAGRQRVTEVIAGTNARIADLARARQVPVVDNFQFANDFFGTNLAPIPSQTIGGVVITNTAGTDPTNAFVDDGAHPHTVLQAGLANVFVTAFNIGHDEQFDIFSEAEMLSVAGLAYGGQDTFQLQYTDYVMVYTLPWHNPDDGLDVSDDGVIAPVDALYIINELNNPVFANEFGRLPDPPPPGGAPPFFDVQADGFVTVGDAVRIIDYLNEKARMMYGHSAEGEASLALSGGDLVASSPTVAVSLAPASDSKLGGDLRVFRSPLSAGRTGEAGSMVVSHVLGHASPASSHSLLSATYAMEADSGKMEWLFESLPAETWFTDLFEEQVSG